MAIIGGELDNIDINLNAAKFAIKIKTAEGTVYAVADNELGQEVFNGYKKGDSIVVYCVVKYNSQQKLNYLKIEKIIPNRGNK